MIGELLRCTETPGIFRIGRPHSEGHSLPVAGGDAGVLEIAEPFPMSQPAISKHLKVLEAASLVSRRRHARQHLCPSRPRAATVTSGPAGSTGSGARASTGWTSTYRTSSRQPRRSLMGATGRGASA